MAQQKNDAGDYGSSGGPQNIPVPANSGGGGNIPTLDGKPGGGKVKVIEGLKPTRDMV